MSTPRNEAPEKWTEDYVSTPFRGTHTDAPGTFRIRDKDRPTVAGGWDVVGEWDVSEEEGIVILRVGLTPSEVVFDDKATLPRHRTEHEARWGGRWRFQDRDRIRAKEIRDTIRDQAAAYLDDPNYVMPDDLPEDHIVRRQIDLIRSAAESKSRTGRPRTPDSELDQWAEDVLRVLSEGPKSLYAALNELWGVGESTIKNIRLPLLRKTGRLRGKGRAMTKGHNYPKEGE